MPLTNETKNAYEIYFNERMFNEYNQQIFSNTTIDSVNQSLNSKVMTDLAKEL